MNTTSAILLMTAALLGADPQTPKEKIEVKSVLVTLIEQVEVPAREAGVLADVLVREGRLVEQGQLLAQIDEKKSLLEEARAEIELENARRESQNDIRVRFAKKSFEVTSAELKRAADSLQRYRKSISQSEIDRLKLAEQKVGLEIEQAQHELDVAQRKLQVGQNEVLLAKLNVQRRKIVSPISGVVVQVNRRRGEWVQPGDPVLRILRIHSLRAEGFIHANDVVGEITDAPVTLHVALPGKIEPVDFPGKLVFVSPEINPVNGQIRVWAEIENRDLRLRPGMRASMTIEMTTAQAEKSQ